MAMALACGLTAGAQTGSAENVFIITTDGFRWQEVFSGADSSLLFNTRFVKDTALARQLWWHPSPTERRKKLLPFFWNVMAQQGQLYGNRQKQSRVNVKNIYKISYPGYNELLTGYPDPLPILNRPQYNRNISVLEYLDNLPSHKGKVAAFTSWDVFPFILNNKRCGITHNSGYAPMADDGEESTTVANAVQQGVEHKYKTRYDALTFFNAKEYIRHHHPKVVFIGLGETDEHAHHGEYDLYLQQAAAVDRMLAELWYLVQTDTAYRNKTTFLISTDHGRGRGTKWTSHHTFIKGSGQIWLGLLGPGIAPLGEMENSQPLHQGQVAATVALLLGQPFEGTRKTAKAINLPATEPSLAKQIVRDATAASGTDD